MDVVTYLMSLNKNSTFLSGVVKLVVLIFVAPATNATSQRSFSALRRVKTYLRTTMTQPRLNHLMLIHIHKEDCDKLNLEQCADDFCANSEHRIIFFYKLNTTFISHRFPVQFAIFCVKAILHVQAQ